MNIIKAVELFLAWDNLQSKASYPNARICMYHKIRLVSMYCITDDDF